MKEKYNFKSLFVAAILMIIGIIMIIISVYIKSQLWNSLLTGIGCSIIASAIVIFAHDFFVEKKICSYLDEWGIDKIYSTRAEKNADSDPVLDKAKYCVDGVAFGLSSFRTKYNKKVEQCLRNGVNFRLLVMNPNSPYISAREKEEGQGIKKSIEDLVKWADQLNKKSKRGKVIVKGYDAMTLDFYWRVDNDLYIGPYWYGYKSSDTVTYKFNSNGKAFQLYTEYFENLWDNTELSSVLTEVAHIRKPKRRNKTITRQVNKMVAE